MAYGSSATGDTARSRLQTTAAPKGGKPRPRPKPPTTAKPKGKGKKGG